MIIIDLLEKNNHNRMAFEYLMAMSLLNKDFKMIAGSLHYLNNFNYSITPKLYQEAYILISSNPENKYPLPEVMINKETIELYRHFFTVINQNRADPQKAIDVLKEEHNDNYFFYCL